MKVEMTVNDFLDRAAAVYPDRVAIVDEPDQPAKPLQTLTYAELADVRRQMGVAMDEMGIPMGGKVAMVSHNAARLQTCFYGVSGNGRIFVPINFRLSADEVRYIVDHSESEALLIDPDLADALADVECERKWVLGEESDAAWLGREGDPVPWTPNEDETASINYTSGTTARPKGVEQSHRARWTNAVTFGWHTGVSDRDVYLHTLPMFHCDGWGMHHAVTGMGGKHVILRKIDGAEILRRVEEHGVTLMCGAPAVVAAVLDAAKDWDGEIPGKGRVRVVVAGAPPPTATIEQVETVLGWELIQIYGLTETAPLLTINRCRPEWDELSPAERAGKLARQGAPALGVEMKVSQSGEFLARSNNVMTGYWSNPEATDQALEGGWFHTGDGGVVDDEGFYQILDRKKDVIISGGENVSSIEVEDALFSHPDISEVAVIGVPHEKWGETVKALVVAVEGTAPTEQDIIDHCRSKIAHYKCPTSVEFRDELARTATGKLQKFKLREPYWEGMDKAVN